jgi:hypothetical protein
MKQAAVASRLQKFEEANKIERAAEEDLIKQANARKLKTESEALKAQ